MLYTKVRVYKKLRGNQTLHAALDFTQNFHALFSLYENISIQMLQKYFGCLFLFRIKASLSSGVFLSVCLYLSLSNSLSSFPVLNIIHSLPPSLYLTYSLFLTHYLPSD